MQHFFEVLNVPVLLLMTAVSIILPAVKHNMYLGLWSSLLQFALLDTPLTQRHCLCCFCVQQSIVSEITGLFDVATILWMNSNQLRHLQCSQRVVLRGGTMRSLIRLWILTLGRCGSPWYPGQDIHSPFLKSTQHSIPFLPDQVDGVQWYLTRARSGNVS